VTDEREGGILGKNGGGKYFALGNKFMGQVILVDSHSDSRRLRSYLKYGIGYLPVELIPLP